MAFKLNVTKYILLKINYVVVNKVIIQTNLKLEGYYKDKKTFSIMQKFQN